jgi:hypothetical protein
MKGKLLLIVFISCILASNTGWAQQQQQQTGPYKIAIFAPLFLDSAFDNMDNYRYAKNQFPEFINPGLEFYEGVQLALDSLSKEGLPLEVFIYDSRSASQSLTEQLARQEMSDIDMVITHCTPNEVRVFADFGLQKSIPVINVNLPNDGGVRSNPYFVMLNSTLKTQIEAVYHHIQRYYASMPVVVFRKKGQIEDMVKNYLVDAGKNAAGVPLKIRYVDLPDSFRVNQLQSYLDSTKITICVAGSLNESFGKRLAQQLASINQDYPVKLVGMPTWDAIKDFSKPEYKDLEIIYCTPFYNARIDKVSTSIINHFNNNMFARPSDMVMRGYEAAWRFGKMLVKYGSDINSNITRREFNVFRDFDIQPVMLNSENLTLDYFENKKLYFLKVQNGVVKAVY